MYRQFSVVIGIVLLGLSLATPTAAQTNVARVRIIHAAVSAPLVDVFVDGERVLEQLSYASLSNYLEVAAGTHTVAVVAAGQDVTTAAISTEVAVEADTAYSVAAIGLPDAPTAVYTDDLSAPAASKARVRVIHTSPDAPGADVQVIDGPTLIQDLHSRRRVPT